MRIRTRACGIIRSMAALLLVPAALLPSPMRAYAKTYYVSAARGHDAQPGSAAQPLRTVQRAADLMATGDVCIVRAGIYRESVTLKCDHVTFRAAPEEAVVISGAEPISGWAKHRGNIYVADTDQPLNQLFMNGKPLTLARDPDTGYHIVDQYVDSSTFVDNELSTEIDWTGATIVGRTKSWSLEARTVQAFDKETHTVRLHRKPHYRLKAKWGYFLNNTLAALDAPGEWYYDADTKKVYVWTPAEDSPAKARMEGSVYATGFRLADRAHVTIEGFDIRHHSRNGILISNSSHLTIRNNRVFYPAAVGIGFKRGWSPQGTASQIIGNTIEGAVYHGIHLAASNSVVANNRITDTALPHRMGKHGLGGHLSGKAINVVGPHNRITGNRIDRTGYVGICLYRTRNSIIARNRIDHSCLTLDDGGGIYVAHAGSDGTRIVNNIILNSVGSTAGKNPSYTGTEANGIYLDDESDGVIASQNTVAHCANYGVFLHNAQNCRVAQNTFYNNFRQLHMVENTGHPARMVENTIVSNVLFCTSKKQVGLYARSGYPDLDFGTCDNNRWYSPATKVVEYRLRKARQVYTFAQWQEKLGQDTHSCFRLAQAGSALFYNDTDRLKRVPLGEAAYRDLDGKAVKGSISLEPFRARVLLLEERK